MPDELRKRDVKLKATQKELKQWVKHHVSLRGNQILGGRPLTGEMMRRRRRNGAAEEEDGEPESENQQTQTQVETDRDVEESQEGERKAPAAVPGLQDSSGQQEQRLVQKRWLVLVLLLSGQTKKTEITDRDLSMKRIKRAERIPEYFVKGLWAPW